MAKKTLSIVLYAHQEYMHHVEEEEFSQWHKSLFSLMTDMYLPLLQSFERMERDNVSFHISMVVTPLLCSMLDNPVFKERYIAWLDRLINFGKSEVRRYKGQASLKKNAELYVLKLQNIKEYYTDVLACDVLSKIFYFAENEYIELLGTTATPLFLPHFIDLDDAINAQIEAGLISHKNYFGIRPDGFWLPYMGYVPGLEKNIRMYGYNYTILETHGLLFANPVPKNGGFSPVRTKNYLALFARNYDSCVDITDDYDFFYNDIYRCEARDIGYEASAKDLSEILFKDGVRFETGFKYWTRKKSAEKAYDPIAASKQVVKDATTFLDARAKKLGEAEKLCKTDVSLVDTFYLPDLGHNWYESVEWLEQVFRQAAKRDDIELKSCSSLVKNQYNLPLVEPTASATTPRGYGDELLDSTNSWMLRYVRKATERMLDLATRFTENTGLKARTLDLAAKQIMIAQSGDWAKMVHLAHNANFADTRFRMSIANFTTVFEYLGANEMSTEWLTRIERQDSLFPWMNYRVFSSKS